MSDEKKATHSHTTNKTKEVWCHYVMTAEESESMARFVVLKGTGAHAATVGRFSTVNNGKQIDIAYLPLTNRVEFGNDKEV